MDGEHRLILLLSLLGVILLALVGLVLLIALWPYRIIIASVLAGLIGLLFLLIIGIAVNEQVLRHKRVWFSVIMTGRASPPPNYISKALIY